MKALYIKSVFLSRKILAHGGGSGIKGEGCQRLFILENDPLPPAEIIYRKPEWKKGATAKEGSTMGRRKAMKSTGASLTPSERLNHLINTSRLRKDSIS